ncbi:YciI family protein [soil metagenome]
MKTLFVVELIYKVPLAQIDATMTAHVRFLKKYYASGHFLVSGRKIPREGGIILAVGESTEAIAAIMAEDPFGARGLAEVRIIQFRASQVADDIQERIAAP